MPFSISLIFFAIILIVNILSQLIVRENFKTYKSSLYQIDYIFKLRTNPLQCLPMLRSEENLSFEKEKISAHL
ncbi:MAG TPA: hypothetical protein DFI01_10080 [Bacteroidales bacterium]|nr:hypothetical protein [Bacteroidales bacterium]